MVAQYSAGRATLSDLKDDMERKIKNINYILVGVVIVVVLAFISMLFTMQSIVITYQKDDSNSYKEYRDELRSQNDKIDALTSELKLQNSKSASLPQ